MGLLPGGPAGERRHRGLLRLAGRQPLADHLQGELAPLLEAERLDDRVLRLRRRPHLALGRDAQAVEIGEQQRGLARPRRLHVPALQRRAAPAEQAADVLDGEPLAALLVAHVGEAQLVEVLPTDPARTLAEADQHRAVAHPDDLAGLTVADHPPLLVEPDGVRRLDEVAAVEGLLADVVALLRVLEPTGTPAVPSS